MPRLFVGNFDFEHELAAEAKPGGSTVPRRAQQASAALASAWLAVAEPQDLVLASEPIDAQSLNDLAEWRGGLPRFLTRLEEAPTGPSIELVPWGWTHRLSELAQIRGWTHAAPPTAVVSQVNSRPFRLALETEWNCGLAGSQTIASLDELAATLCAKGDSPHGWVLKAYWGMSGRERFLGRGTQLTVQAANWARRRLEQAEALVFEPWVDRIEEAGIQLDIPRTGPPVCLGVTPLLCDRTGTYRGNRLSAPVADKAPWQPAIETALRAAARLQEQGYFGPLGIDAMCYRDDAGSERLRPLQDLNARWTMGRLCLGFRRLLRSDQQGAWLHFPLPADKGPAIVEDMKSVSHRLDCDARLIWTSPQPQVPHPNTRGSVLLLATSAEMLHQFETQVLTVLAPHAADWRATTDECP